MSYFQLVRYATKMKQSLEMLLVSPVQRICRYQLVLSDVEKSMNKAVNAAKEEGIEIPQQQKRNHAVIKEAFKLALDLAGYVNDIMDAQRIQNYPVSHTFIKVFNK